MNEIQASPNMKRILSVTDVAQMTGRGRNWVCAASNTGALRSLPRTGRKHQFTEKQVNDWIEAGTPEFPTVRKRLRTA